MKKQILLLLLFSTISLLPLYAMESAITTNNNSNNNSVPNELQKPLVIIFTSSGGGGHTSVAAALTDYLKDDFEVKSVNIFSEVLGSMDLIKTIFFGKVSGESLYNFSIKNKWNSFSNRLQKTGKAVFAKSQKTQSLLVDYLKKEQPNIIISIIPLVNNSILCVASDLLIPFLVIPTDLDMSPFISELNNVDYSDFKCALPFENEELLKIVDIKREQIKITGFPLKMPFFEEKNKEQLKEKFFVMENTPVILILMGAVGLNNIVSFVTELTKIENSAYILICIGKNEELRKRISELDKDTRNKHILFKIISFTDDISDLMAIADLLITKSGTVSFCEGLYMEVPMLLDGTSEPLAWEKVNHEFLVKNSFGEIIKNINELSGIVGGLLSNPDKLQAIKNNLVQFKKENGGQNIKELVKLMLKNKEKNEN